MPRPSRPARLPRLAVTVTFAMTLGGALSSACFVAPEGESTCEPIGRMGGSLQLAGVLLEIPPNALAGEQVLCASILPDETPSGVPALTPVVELTPLETTFAVPARLSLRPRVDVTGRDVSMYESRDGIRYTASKAVADRDIIASLLVFGRFVGGDTLRGGPFAPTEPPPDVGPVTCDPSSCRGCCVDDICLPGTSSANCGQSGAACSACSAPDTCFEQSCQNPFDAGVPNDCGPHNCSGCCSGDVCLPGSSSSHCGQAGAACVPCGSPNACIQNVCQNPNALDGGSAPVDAGTTTGCGPHNCTGCCVGEICLPGTSLSNCGSYGQACEVCEQPNLCHSGSCLPVTDAGSACSAANCSGCCQNGICLPGTRVGTCGSGGNTCTACPPQYVCNGTFCVP